MSRRTAPPTGWPPPETAALGGVAVELGPLCEEIAARYFARHPDDLDRYGREAARAWEIHDTRYVLSWAIGDVEGRTDLNAQITWLASVLHARDFPLEHLATNLDLAADVTAERVDRGAEVAERLHAAAEVIRGNRSVP